MPARQRRQPPRRRDRSGRADESTQCERPKPPAPAFGVHLSGGGHQAGDQRGGLPDELAEPERPGAARGERVVEGGRVRAQEMLAGTVHGPADHLPRGPLVGGAGGRRGQAPGEGLAAAEEGADRLRRRREGVLRARCRRRPARHLGRGKPGPGQDRGGKGGCGHPAVTAVTLPPPRWHFPAGLRWRAAPGRPAARHSHHAIAGTGPWQPGGGRGFWLAQMLAGTPTVVAILNAVLVGAILAIAAVRWGGSPTTALLVGGAGFVVAVVLERWYVQRGIDKLRAGLRPLFPTPEKG